MQIVKKIIALTLLILCSVTLYFVFSGRSSDRVLRSYRFRLPSCSGAVSASDGTVYVGTESSLRAFAEDGSDKWMFPLQGEVNDLPTAGNDGTIYFSAGKALYAVKPDGTLHWITPLTQVIGSSPAIGAEGDVYVGSYEGNLDAFDANGSLKWQFLTDGRIFTSPAVAKDGTVYVATKAGTLFALNPNGTQNWRFPVTNSATSRAARQVSIQSSPAIGPDGTIYFGTDEGIFFAVDSKGKERWSTNFNGQIASTPAISKDGTLYFNGGKEECLYAFDLHGKEKWKAHIGSTYDSSPLLLSDGSICIASEEGLFIIDAGGKQKFCLLGKRRVGQNWPDWLKSPLSDYFNIYGFYPMTPCVNKRGLIFGNVTEKELLVIEGRCGGEAKDRLWPTPTRRQK
ncbi:MAG: cell surface protein [Verrucomicrobiales bacterium]|nr:cell surface protein [Verrucomicrobiales bacterium]